MSADGKRMVVNQAFAAMHGYDSPEQMLQLGLADLDTPETAALAPDRLRRLLAGESFSFEVEHFHRNGHRLALAVSCRVVEVDGKPHFLGFHRDITARKQEEQHRARLEEQLHHAQKMEAIGTLGAGVAHDFNNILGALLGRLSLLELDLGAAADAHRTHLREMRELIERGAALARQLLGLGRRDKYEAQPLDVAAAVRKTSARAPHTGHETILVVDDEPPMRSVCAALLERLGYDVLTASGGREALELVRAHEGRLSLVLLDLTMPARSALCCDEPRLAPGSSARLARRAGRGVVRGARP